jgi:protein arginine kinase activator
MRVGLCERCKKSQATFHLHNISPDGDKSETHLCERCAIEEGLVQLHKPTASQDVVESFIKGAKGSAAAMKNLVCESCGISYLEFRNQGLLGCPKDYDVFRELLTPLLERAHDGATHHVGKAPRSLGRTRTTQQEIRHLRRRLQEAVTAEDYERAAELRDRIQALETS